MIALILFLGAVHWGTVFAGGAFVVTALVVIVLPGFYLFHRKVVRPMRWVLGVTADDSPTGEEVQSVPKQLAQIRQTQLDIVTRTEQLEKNHGGSMRDLVSRTHKLVVKVDTKLSAHLVESAKNETAIWRALAGHAPQETTTEETPDDAV